MAVDARMRFENYVVGPANDGAVAAARAVAGAPGVTHNPLLIHGGPGVGKSHLLLAIGNGVADPAAVVEYLTADEFATQWKIASDVGATEALEHRLVRADVLLIDDVHRLAGRVDAERALAHLIAVREQTDRQVVVTSNGPLDRLEGMDSTLAKQLMHGVSVEISPPGGPTSSSAVSLDFQSFVSDIASAVADHVESWKVRVAEAVSSWNAAGYRTTALERLMDQAEPPANYEAVLRGFGATVRRLKELEAEAVTADPALAGHDPFRDPERLREAEALAKHAQSGAAELPGPSVEFSRNGFAVGASNQRAVHAADAVAAEPGRRYNPLLLIGPPGTGKTHLLNALGNELAKASGRTATVACVGAQAWADEFLGALRDGTADVWRQRYRRIDALLVDDLHAVAGKERTQDELFHLINDLLNAGKQVVMTSERAPRDLQGFDDRIRSAFETGLVVELAPPDAALTEQLYRRFLDGVPAGRLDPLARYLASRPVGSVSDIIETVQRLTAAADAVSTAVTVEMARREFDGPEPGPLIMPTPVRAMPAVSGIADVFFLDHEKVVWEWRDVPSRAIEELR